LGADLAAQEAAGVVETFRGVLALLGIAVDRPVDTRVAQIGRHLHAGDRHQPDPRIAHPAREDLAEQLLDHLRHALRPLVDAHGSSGLVRMSLCISEYVSISISRLTIS